MSYWGAWGAYYDLLGLELDDVLEGPDVVPLQPEPVYPVVRLPSLRPEALAAEKGLPALSRDDRRRMVAQLKKRKEARKRWARINSAAAQWRRAARRVA